MCVHWSWFTQFRYSRTSCQLECELERALSTSDCLPWYKIHINTIQYYKVHITAIEKELDQMFKGICHMIQRTTKRLAGYKKIIFSFQKYQTANSQHLFPVQMRRSGSWREWGTYQIRIAIAYRIVSSWIYSILSAPTNSCESCFCKQLCTFFYILLRRSKGQKV